MAKAAPAHPLSDLPAGPHKTLHKINPSGSLQARRDKSGAIQFFWRYSVGTKSDRVPIGLYDSSAPPKGLQPTARGYSIAAATRAAEELATEHVAHKAIGGRPGLEEARQAAEYAATQAALHAEKHTLANLLDQYCDHQKAIGRKSYLDAKSIFKTHIKDAFPAVAALPAKDVTTEQFADMMRKLIEAKKGRTANKLRSYARSAYQLAKSAKSKPSVPIAFKAFDVTTNPVADTMPDESSNKPAKNPLSIEDLRTYWHGIRKRKDFAGALLQLHLITGAQRIEQLLNLRTAHVEEWRFTIYDGKGRPGAAARPHLVPMIKAARTAMKLCKPTGEYALSSDGGKTHVSASTFTKWAAEAGKEIKGFQPKRLRSGVETLLARNGISREHRGYLQSHGISGVQARHYDGYEYAQEKRDALYTLFEVLDAEDYWEPVPESVRIEMY